MLASKFGELSSVPESGIDLEGVHYIVPLTEEGLIFGKKGKSGRVWNHDFIREALRLNTRQE